MIPTTHRGGIKSQLHRNSPTSSGRQISGEKTTSESNFRNGPSPRPSPRSRNSRYGIEDKSVSEDEDIQSQSSSSDISVTKFREASGTRGNGGRRGRGGGRLSVRAAGRQSRVAIPIKVEKVESSHFVDSPVISLRIVVLKCGSVGDVPRILPSNTTEIRVSESQSQTQQGTSTHRSESDSKSDVERSSSQTVSQLSHISSSSLPRNINFAGLDTFRFSSASTPPMTVRQPVSSDQLQWREIDKATFKPLDLSLSVETDHGLFQRRQWAFARSETDPRVPHGSMFRADLALLQPGAGPRTVSLFSAKVISRLMNVQVL